MHTVISARILAETASSIKRSEEDGTMDTVSSATAGVPFSKVFFILAFVLSVLLRYTNYDYPFGLSKLLLPSSIVTCLIYTLI